MKTRSETPEQFEQFKHDLIARLNELKYEDDPHICLVSGKGHGEVNKMALGCPGWMMGIAVEIIEQVNESHVSKIYTSDVKPQHIAIVEEEDELTKTLNDLKVSGRTEKGGEA